MSPTKNQSMDKKTTDGPAQRLKKTKCQQQEKLQRHASFQISK